MNYRMRRDPEQNHVIWRVKLGRREWSVLPGSAWWIHSPTGDSWALPTPERIAMWLDLAMNPLEP